MNVYYQNTQEGHKRGAFCGALATNIGDTFLYEKGKESRGEAGKARDARAA